MLNDVFFKSLLCDDRHKELTLNFLNSILNRTGDEAFYDIEFLDKEIDPIIEAGKVSILDIRAKMNDDTYVNVEVQIAKPVDMKNVLCSTGQNYIHIKLAKVKIILY